VVGGELAISDVNASPGRGETFSDALARVFTMMDQESMTGVYVRRIHLIRRGMGRELLEQEGPSR